MSTGDLKRKAAILLLFAGLAAALLPVAGCGRTDQAGTQATGRPQRPAPTYGLDGTYRSTGTAVNPDARFLVLKEDGTFEGNVWGSSKTGFYRVGKGREAGVATAVFLTFYDRTPEEKWDVVEPRGAAAAIVSPVGTRYERGADGGGAASDSPGKR